MEAVSDAIADLYQQGGCAVGGPLHIVVDDFNTEDHNILWCLTQNYGDDYDERTWNIVHAIAWGLLSIDWEAARMVAIHDAHALVMGHRLTRVESRWRDRPDSFHSA